MIRNELDFTWQGSEFHREGTEETNEFCEADYWEKGMVKVRGSKWWEA